MHVIPFNPNKQDIPMFSMNSDTIPVKSVLIILNSDTISLDKNTISLNNVTPINSISARCGDWFESHF